MQLGDAGRTLRFAQPRKLPFPLGLPIRSASTIMRARGLLAALAVLACLSAAAAAAATPELGHFLDKARGIEDWLVSTRRLLHTIPELFYEVG